MFAGKEKSDIFKIHSHGIIGGKEDHQRLFITQMGFGSMSTGVSVMPFASLARVFPVQGAMSRRSR